MARVLEAGEPAGVSGQRFVTAFGRFQQFPEPIRRRVTGEPYAYFWGRLAYELLHAVLHKTPAVRGLAGHYCQVRELPPAAALASHLEDFSRLLIAGAVLEGIDFELEHPLEVDTPFAVPGTSLSFDAGCPILVRGVRDGRPEAAAGLSGSILPVEYPTLGGNDREWRLQPAVFNITASGISADLARIDRAFQTAHANRVDHACSLLQSLEEGCFQQVRTGLRVIALRPEGRPGALVNVSHCDLPGAIALHPGPHPHELANLLWHEFLHNRLFALEENGRFLKQEGSSDGAGTRVYSPWRSDHRPPHGLLHAVYVFTGVGRYWLSVAANDETPASVRELARNRILSGLYQVRLGVASLRRYPRFTGRGEELMGSLEEAHQALWRDARDFDIEPDMPRVTFRPGTEFDIDTHDETVRQHLGSHLRRCGNTDEIDFLEPLLRA